MLNGIGHHGLFYIRPWVVFSKKNSPKIDFQFKVSI